MTFVEAKKLAKANPNTVYFCENGMTKVYFCTRRNRMISFHTNDGKVWF